jgi:hypothetical protein
MSKARLLALSLVIVLGLVWFSLGRTDREAQSQTSRGDSANAADGVASPSPRTASASRTVATQNAKSAGSSAEQVSQDSSASDEPALRAFQAESTRAWTVRRSGIKNAIKTLARGLWTSGNSGDYRTLAQTFVHDYSDALLGIPSDEVSFVREEVTDRTKIVYEQNVNGTPVYGGSLVLFFENGGLTRVQNDLFAKEVSASAAPTGFGYEQALERMNSGDGARYSLLSGFQPRTVLYPGPTSLVYAYEFSVRDSADQKSYRILYDAEAQTLIKKTPTQVR